MIPLLLPFFNLKSLKMTRKKKKKILKIGKTIPKKSMGYQIYFLIIFILRTD